MRIASLLLLVGCTLACGPSVSSSGEPAPRTALSDLLGGTQPNDALPSDGKADDAHPARYTELVALQSPVKNQGHRGLCSIFSSTALLEHLQIEAGRTPSDLSEQFLQWSAKHELERPYAGEASGITDVLDALQRFGAVEGAQWPYDYFRWNATDDPACVGAVGTQPVRCLTNGEPPPAALAAPRTRLPRWHQVPVASIQSHMTATRTAVVAAVEVFVQAWNDKLSPLRRNGDNFDHGIVLYPNDADVVATRSRGSDGHAFLIVGWDDDLALPLLDERGAPTVDASGAPVLERGFYIFKNSYGTLEFGFKNPYGAGFGLVSKRYVETFGYAYGVDGP